MRDRNITQETAIFNLWLNWVVAGGLLVMPNIISVYAAPWVVPPVVLLSSFLLTAYNRSSLRTRTAVCPQVLTISLRSLMMSGLIMVVIMLIYSKGIIDLFFESEALNKEQPFITALILSPVLLANVVWAQIRGTKYEACRRCRMVLGTLTERGSLGKLYSDESRYQRIFLLCISAVLTLISWGYYLYYYINVNVNIPDRFFFGWVPTILYLVSVGYLAVRYFTIWAHFYQAMEKTAGQSGASTSIRFIVMCGESFFIGREDELGEHSDLNKYDTPALLAFNYRSEVPLDEAREIFSKFAQIAPESFDIRFMYYSADSTGSHNIFHFICCLKDPQAVDSSLLKGEWLTIPQLERLLHNRDITPMLASEIHRLYTVTMAWKTYDADGRRLYKVKNYRPVFRISGICDWDVDFNSPLWLRVAEFNEDKPLFRLRRLLHRLGGSDKR